MTQNLILSSRSGTAAAANLRGMGFSKTAVDTRVEVPVVVSARGKLTLLGVHHAKARVFVLENKTAVVVLPNPNDRKQLLRTSYEVLGSEWQPAVKLMIVHLDVGVLMLDANGCGCGMGAVGNAGPTAEPYRLVNVRAPDWHTVV